MNIYYITFVAAQFSFDPFMSKMDKIFYMFGYYFRFHLLNAVSDVNTKVITYTIEWRISKDKDRIESSISPHTKILGIGVPGADKIRVIQVAIPVIILAGIIAVIFGISYFSIKEVHEILTPDPDTKPVITNVTITAIILAAALLIFVVAKYLLKKKI